MKYTNCKTLLKLRGIGAPLTPLKNQCGYSFVYAAVHSVPPASLYVLCECISLQVSMPQTFSLHRLITCILYILVLSIHTYMYVHTSIYHSHSYTHTYTLLCIHTPVYPYIHTHHTSSSINPYMHTLIYAYSNIISIHPYTLHHNYIQYI